MISIIVQGILHRKCFHKMLPLVYWIMMFHPCQQHQHLQAGEITLHRYLTQRVYFPIRNQIIINMHSYIQIPQNGRRRLLRHEGGRHHKRRSVSRGHWASPPRARMLVICALELRSAITAHAILQPTITTRKRTRTSTTHWYNGSRRFYQKTRPSLERTSPVG